MYRRPFLPAKLILRVHSFKMFSSTTMLALIGSATATILWDGRLNNETSSAFLDDWSFSNTVGQYQYAEDCSLFRNWH